MTLRTSYRNINPASNMYLATLRRMLPLLIISSIAFLLVCPSFFTFNARVFIDDVPEQLQDELFKNEYNFFWLLKHVTFDIKGMNLALTVIAYMFAVAAPIVLNIINFSFLFSKKSSDFYLALPLKRTEMFISRSLASFTVAFIPVALAYSAMMFLSVSLPHNEGGIIDVVYGFAYVIIAMLLSHAISLIFICCAGAAGDFVLSLLGVNAGLLAVAAIIGFLLSDSLFGFSFDKSAPQIFAILSPPYYCVAGCIGHFVSESNEFDFVYFIRNIIVIAALYTASVFLFKRRKAEKGGQGYAYFFMYVICSIIASVCIAFVMGIMFGLFRIGIAFFVFGAVGSIGAAILFGAISYRGFKTIKRSLILGGIAAMIPITIYVIGLTGFFGYSSYVPKAENVKSATVSCNYDVVEQNDAKLVTALHQKIVDKRSEYEYMMNEDWFEPILDDSTESESGYVRIYDFEISYLLKDGRTVNRSFSVPEEIIEEEYRALITSDYRFDDMVKKAKTVPDGSVGIYVYSEENREDVTYVLVAEYFEEFIGIFKEEVKTAPFSENAQINFTVEEYKADYYQNYYYSFDVDACTECPEALEYLEKYAFRQNNDEPYFPDEYYEEY